ncbi:DUF1471 domain-containing protein, partial [Enterobacter sp. BA-045-C-ECC]|uniref:DUF1471 domain-containing protein n=1 Tax=Enterobacter sp. BA-045-C-ECC TaxID=3397221 RepID=UPI0039DFD683
AYGPQNDVTLKMPAFEWVHVQLHQQKGMISLSPPTICNSAELLRLGSISVSGGTIDELTSKLAAKAEKSGADYFRITYLNTNAHGYATATLYDNAGA